MSDRIRVLQIVPDLSLGGAERMATHLTLALDATRFDAVLASLYDPLGTDLERMLADAGRPARHLGKRRGFDARMFFALHRLIGEIRPHVVHTHTISLRYAFPVAWLRRVPVRLHTIHSQAEKEAGRWVRLRRAAFRSGVVPVAIAHEVAAGIRRTYGIDDAPLVPNGIPVARYARPRTARAEWRRREGIAESDVAFCIVGRLDAGKNHALAIRALAALDGGARLLCAGGGPAERFGELRALAEREGVAGRVHLLGRRDDIPELLHACDAFVLPSDFEGSPLTVIEAMAAGRAVIATAVGGVPELVADGRTGLLVPPGDGGALRTAMARLAAEPSLREAMGRSAAEIARERFDVSTMAEGYARLYLERLGAPAV